VIAPFCCRKEEVRLTENVQHGIPRVSGIARDKTVAAKEKERRQIEQYQALETDVRDRVWTKFHVIL